MKLLVLVGSLRRESIAKKIANHWRATLFSTGRAVSSTDRCGYRVPGVVFRHSLVDGPRSVYAWVAFTWKE